MNTFNAGSLFRRIAVALDDSMQSGQALQTAAELAASLQVELEGIFFEDINLIHLAELPFAREIRPASMTEETVSAQRMEQELRSQARQQQKKLELVAHEKGISCSFRIRRGQIKSELMAAVAEVDVLTLCRPARMSEKFKRETIGFPLITALPMQKTNTSVSVIFGSAQNEKMALMVAVQLAGRLDVEIRVLVTGDSDAEIDDLLRQADTILGTQKQQVSYIHLPGKQISDLVIATASSNSQVLLVNSNNSIVTGGQLWPYLEQLSLPVLIIREQTAKTSNA